SSAVTIPSPQHGLVDGRHTRRNESSSRRGRPLARAERPKRRTSPARKSIGVKLCVQLFSVGVSTSGGGRLGITSPVSPKTRISWIFFALHEGRFMFVQTSSPKSQVS